MNNQVTFIPLGGGQRVGASCYYLQLGSNNIILDAGTGKKNGVVCNPVLSQLLALPSVYSFNQINQIFISHAHLDHTGYLKELKAQCVNASVYMTEITKSLTELQTYDRKFFNSDSSVNEEKRLETQINLDRITTVSYMQSMRFPEYRVTFFPAGHLPGAMMTLFEYKNRKILYTGDYSVDPTPLCPPCFLPDNIKIDTVIMCGLHAKHPDYKKRSDGIFELADHALDYVKKRRRSIQCSTVQLSKGIEFLKLLNEKNTGHVPVYIDRNLIQIIEKFEKLGIRVLNEDNRLMQDRNPLIPHIYVTSSDKTADRIYDEKLNADFTLHEDFSQMKKFIETISPKQVIMVHCSPAHCGADRTIEQEMLINSSCDTQFIFAEDQEIYNI